MYKNDNLVRMSSENFKFEINFINKLLYGTEYRAKKLVL